MDKSTFDKHAEWLGLRINDYFACALVDENVSDQMLYAIYLDSPTRVRIQYFFSSKTGNLTFTPEQFMAIDRVVLNDIESSIRVWSKIYDDAQKQLKAIPNNLKETIKGALEG